MAVFAHMSDEAERGDGGASETPRAPRRTLSFLASGSLASGEATNVIVHNVSATGLLLESRLALAVGESIAIDLPQAGLTAARVVWRSGTLAGCQFDEPVTQAALSAVQLQSAVDREIEIDGEPVAEAREESFGARLRRYRKARKLTLDQVALHLGVSKPTVWAWEQDKARPVDSRLAELAQVLGVAPVELQSTYDAPPLMDVIARSKRQIAAIAGVAISKIKVMIEL